MAAGAVCVAAMQAQDSPQEIKMPQSARTVSRSGYSIARLPAAEVHRLANPGKILLELIEVQTGSYLGDDDIVRLEDEFGRADKPA